MAQHTAYAADQVAATLDGLRVVGLGDGDNAIEISQGSDEGTGKVGVQGDSIWSGSADKSATITLRLHHTSPTHRLLTQKYQQARGGLRRAFPFSVKDTGSGEGGSAPKCYIQSAPTVQMGQNAQNREWTLWTGEWNVNIPREVV